jgi:quinol monooxygenase YgiN
MVVLRSLGEGGPDFPPASFGWLTPLPMIKSAMNIERRTMMGGLVAVSACGGTDAMYGLIGKMIAKAGQRDALIAILSESIGGMPGCRSYVIATDPTDANAIWITEVWDNEQFHTDSLQLPQVQAAIARARPMIEGFGERFITTPVGGVGI